MQKNLYYRNIFQRQNVFKNFLLGIFSMFSSYARLLLEVFIRRDFGERYFQLSSAITVAVILLPIPFIPNYFEFGEFGHSVPMAHYLTWYLFIALFLFYSVRRYQEIRRNPSVFDFAKFSLSSGKINPAFYNIQIKGIKTDVRTIETLFEPGLFFILGIILLLLGQKVGWLLAACSIIYAVSYVQDYYIGDHFIMDKIDEMICNEELKKAFVDNADADETRGFRFKGKKPGDAEMRRQVLPLMISSDEEIFEVQ